MVSSTTSVRILRILPTSGSSLIVLLLEGMQRFGTSPIPTHSIGLALLQSNWKRALSLVLRPRQGEVEEADAARRAWLEERDLQKALRLMPRRMVAERAVLEAYKKNFNSDSDMQNALLAVRTFSGYSYCLP